MTTIYKVRASRDLHPSDPLHVGHFYADLQRRHRGKMQDRQDLILYLAKLHTAAMDQGASTSKPRAFCEVSLRLMSLRDWVYDYRNVLDHFFEVKQTGYNLGDGDHEVSTLIPKLLDQETLRSCRDLDIHYVPPPKPIDGVTSKVYIQQYNAATIRARLAAQQLAELQGAVEWLLKRQEVDFIFQPAGRLKQRDTSVWPIAAIETWPSWLREQLFGSGVDIENAYTQFLIGHLKQAHTAGQLQVLYPDLKAAIEDKHRWRVELCSSLGIPSDDEGMSTVKRICMSLANGSRISPGILTGGQAFSVTAGIVVKAADDISIENLDRIGDRLQRIANQYTRAKKVVCNQFLGLNPTRTNQKLVFGSYFAWEREARYAIWNAVDRHGIMVHDGIDGIPARYTADIQGIINQVGLKVSV